MRRHPKFPFRTPRAFTLIELMIVVSIMGLMLMIGVPPMVKATRKKGMNKAIADVYEACRVARQSAILSQGKSTLTIHPHDGAISAGGFSGHIPPEVTIISVGVNFIEFIDSDAATVTFFPNGTSDEFSITLRGEKGEIRQIYLDIVTASPQIKDM